MDIIEMTPTSRLTIEQDTDAQNPREDWDMITGTLTIEAPWNRNTVFSVHTFPGDIADAQYRLNSDDIAVLRWARVFHLITLDYSEGTYWWADPEQMTANWPELIQGSSEYVEKESEVIKQEQAVYQTWCDGEVYVVSLDRKFEWIKVTEPTEDTESREEWEPIESLGGCYLDDTYTAQAVALESFTLTDPENSTLNEFS